MPTIERLERGSFAPLKCEICNGSGSLFVSATCQYCDGTSEVIIYDDDGTELLSACFECDFGLIYSEVPCEACRGTGWV